MEATQKIEKCKISTTKRAKHNVNSSENWHKFHNKDLTQIPSMGDTKDNLRYWKNIFLNILWICPSFNILYYILFVLMRKNLPEAVLRNETTVCHILGFRYALLKSGVNLIIIP